MGIAIGEHHRLLFGLGYRFTISRVDNTPVLAVLPARLERNLFSSFLQDEIIITDHLKLTLGSKFEVNVLHWPGNSTQRTARLDE